MRVVLDTNVVVSGVFWKGIPAKIFDAWVDGRFDILVSSETYREYQEVFARFWDQESQIDIPNILSSIAAKALWVSPPALAGPICDDPDDDKFIAVALAGHAQYIVTGDKALLRVRSFQRIRIVPPRHFLEQVL